MRRLISKGISLMALCAMIASVSVPAHAGSGGVQYTGIQTVLGKETDRYQVRFFGGEQAMVSAGGTGDIDLYIYNSRGQLVAWDQGWDFMPLCLWTPATTDVFTIHVVNVEYDAVKYRLVTN